MARFAPTRRKLHSLFVFPLLALALSACTAVENYELLNRDADEIKTALAPEITAGTVVVDQMSGRVKITFRDKVMFPEGSWRVNGRAEALVAKLVPTLKTLKNTKIVVDGYTDNLKIGNALRRQGVTSNLDLSSRRADTVAQELVRQGVNSALVSAQGFGEANPIASNDTPAGRSAHRRIELSLGGNGG